MIIWLKDKDKRAQQNLRALRCRCSKQQHNSPGWVLLHSSKLKESEMRADFQSPSILAKWRLNIVRGYLRGLLGSGEMSRVRLKRHKQVMEQWRVELITGRPDVGPVYGGERATKGRAHAEGLRGASAYRYNKMWRVTAARRSWHRQTVCLCCTKEFRDRQRLSCLSRQPDRRGSQGEVTPNPHTHTDASFQVLLQTIGILKEPPRMPKSPPRSNAASISNLELCCRCSWLWDRCSGIKEQQVSVR